MLNFNEINIRHVYRTRYIFVDFIRTISMISHTQIYSNAMRKVYVFITIITVLSSCSFFDR